MFKYYLRKIYYQILFKDKIDKRALKNLQSGFLNENFKKIDLLLNEKFTKFSMVIIKLINFKKVIKRKKEKFKDVLIFIENNLKDYGEIVFDFHNEKIIPSSIPFIINTKKQSNIDIVEDLTRNNIQVYFWPNLPIEIKDNRNKYNLSNFYKEKIIHFPI